MNIRAGNGQAFSMSTAWYRAGTAALPSFPSSDLLFLRVAYTLSPLVIWIYEMNLKHLDNLEHSLRQNESEVTSLELLLIPVPVPVLVQDSFERGTYAYVYFYFPRCAFHGSIFVSFRFKSTCFKLRTTITKNQAHQSRLRKTAVGHINWMQPVISDWYIVSLSRLFQCCAVLRVAAIPPVSIIWSAAQHLFWCEPGDGGRGSHTFFPLLLAVFAVRVCGYFDTCAEICVCMWF